jgi:hypothetical protein
VLLQTHTARVSIVFSVDGSLCCTQIDFLAVSRPRALRLGTDVRPQLGQLRLLEHAVTHMESIAFSARHVAGDDVPHLMLKKPSRGGWWGMVGRQPAQ